MPTPVIHWVPQIFKTTRENSWAVTKIFSLAFTKIFLGFAMFLSIIFLLASTNFAFNCADNAKGSDEIHPNFADYNPNKLLGELQEMANSLSDAGGKAAEEMALVKGCQIIQKLQGNSTKYPKVVAEHSEFARLLQSVAKVCNEAKKDNSTSNFELIETFEKNGPPILAQLKLKEQQLLQELKNAKKDSELIEISGLVAKLCLNVLPEGHPWKSALKELLGDNVHLLPSDLVQFLISKMNFMTEQQLGSPKAYHRRIRRAVQRRRWPIVIILIILFVVIIVIIIYVFNKDNNH